MAKFSELLPWLRTLFPPAEARGFQPSEVSEDISLVHQVHQGTEILDNALVLNLSSAAGVTFIDGPTVPDQFYHYVIAAGGFHNDGATARELFLQISRSAPAANFPIATAREITFPSTQYIASPRSFIVPSDYFLRLSVPAIAVGSLVTLRAIYFEIPVGLPAVPSP